jgi:hypothetical protein
MSAIGLTLLLGVVPASAGAQTTGEIGGPPTNGSPLPFPPPHKRLFLPKATTEAIVIGVGFTAFGKVELVAQGISKQGLCIFIDHLQRADGGSDTCAPTVLPRVIKTDSIIWESQRRHSRSLTELSGFMQPSVASVIAVAHPRKGRKRSTKLVPGVIAVPGPDLLARLHQAAPFGYFVSDFRGCITDVKVRVHAFDPAGLLLGSSLANLGFPNRFQEFDPCRPGSSSVGFGTSSSAQTAVAR